jgi:hypothetical protein
MKKINLIGQRFGRLTVIDSGTSIEYARRQTGKKSGVIGYCFGGTIVWLAAARLGVDTAVGYNAKAGTPRSLAVPYSKSIPTPRASAVRPGPTSTICTSIDRRRSFGWPGGIIAVFIREIVPFSAIVARPRQSKGANRPCRTCGLAETYGVFALDLVEDHIKLAATEWPCLHPNESRTATTRANSCSRALELRRSYYLRRGASFFRSLPELFSRALLPREYV